MSVSEGQSSANEPLSAEQATEPALQFELDVPLPQEAATNGGRAEDGASASASVHRENSELKTKLQLLEESEANMRKTMEVKEEEMTRLQSEVMVLQEKLQRWEESDANQSSGGRGASPSGGSKKGSAGGKSRHNR